MLAECDRAEYWVLGLTAGHYYSGGVVSSEVAVESCCRDVALSVAELAGHETAHQWSVLKGGEEGARLQR